MMATCTRTRRMGPSRSCGIMLAVIAVVVEFLPGAVGESSPDIVCSSGRGRGECIPTYSNCIYHEPDCQRNTVDPASLYNSSYTEYPGTKDCIRSTMRSTSSTPTQTIAQNLTVIFYPIGQSKKFNLYVSWNATNTDSNITGFYIWNYKCSSSPCNFPNNKKFPSFERGQHECLPVRDPSVRSVLFDGAAHKTELLNCKDELWYTAERCTASHFMTVMVVPWPPLPDIQFSDLLTSSSLTVAWSNLDWCWPTLYSSNCAGPVFIQPVEEFNLTATVTAEGEEMQVHVNWGCTPGDVEYIVTITDPVISTVPNCTSPGLNPPCFVARNTTHVSIEGLAIKEYSISVQVVPRCSGTSFAKHFIGCLSEECCGAKRIAIESVHSVGPVSSELAVVRSSCSHSRLHPFKTSSQSSTKTLPHSVSITPSGTVTPPHEKQRKTDIKSIGRTGKAIIGAVLVVIIAIFLVTIATFLVYSFTQRRFKTGSSLHSSSSLSESLQTLERGEEGNGYHTEEDLPSYTPALRGGEEDSDMMTSSLESPEGSGSQKTIEVSSMADGSETMTYSSELEKISGVSVSLDDDAFEISSLWSRGRGGEGGGGSRGGRVEGEEEAGEKVDLSKTNGDLGSKRVDVLNKRLQRTRSESVQTKSVINGSVSSPRKRPHSLSSSQATQGGSPCLSALIIYSKASPDLEQRTIQQLLVSDLTGYNIRTVSQDTSTPRESPASWLVAQMREVSAVFCVCNKAFDNEWENHNDGYSSLVPVFKQFCHGLVTPSYGKNQALQEKIAIVLSRESDLQYVPTYLNSRPKFRLDPDDLIQMARFVAGLPEYQCDN